MRIVALTGNVASGKSSVDAILRSLGAHVIEADALVHEMQRAGTPVYRAIVDRFGPELLRADGELDRGALRALILSDAKAKADLEAIVHPAVAAEQRASLRAAELRGEALVIMDIPLLFEAGNPAEFTDIILVEAPVALRRHRLVHERGLSPEEADRLINIQMPSEAKHTQSQWIIANDADMTTLTHRVEKVWRALSE
jgi:dephospho-CoA kinase